MDSDINADRLIERREIKRRRLHELDKQADYYGEPNVPPHIEMERVQLRAELGIVESAIRTPARAAIGDELGPANRFLVYYEQNRQIMQKLELLGERMGAFILETEGWRRMHRTLITFIIVALIAILIIVVAVVTYLTVRGGG